MAFVPFPNTVLLTHRFDWNGQPVSIGLHLERAGYTPANAQLLAQDAGTSFVSTINAVQTNQILMGLVVVQDLSSAGAPNYENPDEIGISGDLVIDGAPNNTALLLSHRTADTGRSARGRTYMPGMTDTQVVLGLPSAAAIALWAIEWAAYVVDIEFQGWTLVVAQRVADGVPLAQGVTREVTSTLFPVRLGTQRLRQAG